MATADKLKAYEKKVSQTFLPIVPTKKQYVLACPCCYATVLIIGIYSLHNFSTPVCIILLAANG